jgi:hypothetical protein
MIKRKKLKADDRQVSSLFKKTLDLHILTRNGVKYNLKTSCNFK